MKPRAAVMEVTHDPVEDLRVWLGLTPAALRNLQREATAEQLVKLYDASQPFPFIGIAGMDWFSRRSYFKQWSRIDLAFAEGNIDLAIDELRKFRSEVQACILHDPRFTTAEMVILSIIFMPFLLVLFIPYKIYEAFLAVKATFFPAGSQPPLLGEMLIYLALPKANRQQALGDLAEEYQEFVLGKFGKRYAVAWYWWQVAGAVLFRPVGRFCRWSIEKFGEIVAQFAANLLKP